MKVLEKRKAEKLKEKLTVRERIIDRNRKAYAGRRDATRGPNDVEEHKANLKWGINNDAIGGTIYKMKKEPDARLARIADIARRVTKRSKK